VAARGRALNCAGNGRSEELFYVASGTSPQPPHCDLANNWHDLAGALESFDVCLIYQYLGLPPRVVEKSTARNSPLRMKLSILLTDTPQDLAISGGVNFLLFIAVILGSPNHPSAVCLTTQCLNPFFG
jgi:hypothetical protein